MENKKTILLIIGIVLIVVLIIGTAVMINVGMNREDTIAQKVNSQTSITEKQNIINEEQNVLEEQDKVNEEQNVVNEQTTVIEKTDEDIVEDLVLEEIKKRNAEYKEELIDYKVDSIHILSEEERQELTENMKDLKQYEILATVEYSVKPKDVNNTSWIAGNGRINGEWISAGAVFAAKDGKLAFMGTGW